MDTKTYLGQISRLDRMIENKISEITRLKVLFYGLSAVKLEERVQTTPNHDKMGTAYAKIHDRQTALDQMIDEYVDKKAHIVEQIEKMEDENHYAILFSRYVTRKGFSDIAVEIGYSERQVLRLHGEALDEFESKYGSEYKDVTQCH